MTCKHYHHTNNIHKGKQQQNLGLNPYPSFYSTVENECHEDLVVIYPMNLFIYLWILGTLQVVSYSRFKHKKTYRELPNIFSRNKHFKLVFEILLTKRKLCVIKCFNCKI